MSWLSPNERKELADSGDDNKVIYIPDGCTHVLWMTSIHGTGWHFYGQDICIGPIDFSIDRVTIKR